MKMFCASPFESHISIFYKLLREEYVSRARLLKKYKTSEANHFLPHMAPTWLKMNCKAPDLHLPTTFCPGKQIVDPREMIKYCKICIGVGYHSVFFMLGNVHWCLIHRCELDIMCSSCQARFLGTVAIDTYFDCSIDVGRVDVLCSKCNASWPNLHQDSTGFWPIGHSDFLDAERLLKHQSDWYLNVMSGVAKSSSFCKEYFTVLVDSLTISALESRYSLTSPESIIGTYQKSGKVYWLRFDNRLPSLQMTTNDYYQVKATLADICEDIKQKYLSRHCECYERINQLTSYHPIKDATTPFCLLGLAYVLFRLKLACSVWPTPNSVSAEKSCFDNLLRHIDHDLNPVKLRKLLTFIFLKTLSDIEYKMAEGRSCRVLLRYHQITDDFFCFRRTRYSSRIACNYDWEIEAACVISACASGNRLTIYWRYDQDSVESMLIL
ncbi:hypothetical protein NLO95_20815 [Pseudomonas syringae]|nr:hypothetical protein [Pseudomonas syringae]